MLKTRERERRGKRVRKGLERDWKGIGKGWGRVGKGEESEWKSRGMGKESGGNTVRKAMPARRKCGFRDEKTTKKRLDLDVL